MKQAYFLLLLFAMIITSCGDQTPSETDTNNTTDTTQATNTTTDTPEPQPEETYKTTSPYAAEIKMVEDAVAKIEGELSSYTETKKPADDSSCEVVKLTNADGVDMKISSVCTEGKASKETWVFYNAVLSGKDTKIIFTKYSKEEYNEADGSVANSTVRQAYTIGHFVEGEEHFGLVLDEKGNKVEEGLGEFNQKSEEMYVQAAMW